MTFHDLVIAPFADFAFMRRALVASFALSLGAGPIGTFLILRRMSLMGDALSHAILPGAAIGFLLAGLSLPAMSFGGLAVGLAVALASGVVSRLTAEREDTSFAALYLLSLAIGVLIVSAWGSSVDLLQILFGSVLAVDRAALLLVATVSTVTILALAIIYRPLIADCVDPGFLRTVGGQGGLWHSAFLVLVVLNLVAGFQSLGTLMAVGLIILPAAAARFWGGPVIRLAAASAAIAFFSAAVGLLLSYHLDLPAGPAIIVVAGIVYVVSLAVSGRRRSLAHAS
ncbi:MAG TPA: metal ABC transporter permease [Alphaproteobacteria bacterium]|nr:metal ABC transporter permease [Alphaproteobacteria bacterium]